MTRKALGVHNIFEHDWQSLLDRARNLMGSETLNTIAEGRFISGNRVTLLRAGATYFPAIFEALAAARHSIRLEMYAIWDGALSVQLCQILKGRAAAGVAVHVIADAIGSRAWSNEAIAELRQAGAEIVLYSPFSVRRIHHLSRRRHRKLVIADSTVAFVGGFNFVDVFAGTVAEAAWLDYVVEMKGPAVSDAASRFDRAWRLLVGRHIDAVETAGVAGSSDVLLIDSPSESGRRTVLALHKAVISSARQRVSIHNPFFMPGEEHMKVISAATKRGVEVRVIVPGSRMAHRLLLDANRYCYRKALAAGVRIFEYQRAMMHAKTIVVDGGLALVGSANFDPRSMYSNDELTAAISDVKIGRSMEAHFASDLADCIEICSPPGGTLSERLRQRAAATLIPFL